MRPKTKLQKAVAKVNATLSEDIARTNAEQAKQACMEWDMRHYCYFALHSTIKGYKVKRLYRIYRFTDLHTDHFFFVEIIREFANRDGKWYFAKARQMGKYYDCFTYSSDIELREIYKNYCNYDLTQLFDLSVQEWKEDRKSERVSCVKINPNEIARVIMNNPVAENLYKDHDPLFTYLLFDGYAKQICRAITLAKRHGFVFNPQTTSIWFDLVRSIIYCKKDWHNPIYIAPKNLMETHDRFTDMASRERKKREEARRRRREEERHRREFEATNKVVESDESINEKYIKRRKKFYDMVISDGLIECRVLRDVPAFKDEGMAMAHCVYSMRYFNKPYSLILSAKIGEQRIETIEVSLTNYTIKQCFGKHDQFTIYHNRIVNLVKSEMETIKSYNRRRVRKAV